MSGLSFAIRRKSQNVISRHSSGVTAVTVAVRTPSLISASSPKCSPAPSRATSRPSTTTDASPSVIDEEADAAHLVLPHDRRARP